MNAAVAYNPIIGVDAWGFASETDRRFRKISRIMLLLFLMLAVAIPFLQFAGMEKGGGDVLDRRYVTVIPDAEIAEKVEEPAPAEEESPKAEEPKPEEPKAVEKPKPKAEPKVEPRIEQPVVQAPPQPTREELVANARQKAASTGVMAMADQLKALRDNSLTGLDASRPLNSSIVTAQAGAGGGGGAPASAIAQSVASNSGGISGAGTGEQRRSATGAGLGQRRTTVVESPIGAGPDKTRPGQNGDKLVAGRTLEEIQLVFDRSKSAITSIYQRALRDHPEMSGKLVVSLTIAPDGSVTACNVVSSELGDPELEQRLVQRIKLLNFGAKNVPPYTYPNYPLNFLPA